MKDKRVILNITGELHSKLKQYAAKDERTLNTVLRKILLAGVNALNIEKETLLNNVVNNIVSVVKDTEVITSLTDKELTHEELNAKHGRTLSDFEVNEIRKDPNYKLTF
jgi:PIN domain nuclease of toxin-antitoxin system